MDAANYKFCRAQSGFTFWARQNFDLSRQAPDDSVKESVTQESAHGHRRSCHIPDSIAGFRPACRDGLENRFGHYRWLGRLVGRIRLVHSIGYISQCLKSNVLVYVEDKNNCTPNLWRRAGTTIIVEDLYGLFDFFIIQSN